MRRKKIKRLEGMELPKLNVGKKRGRQKSKEKKAEDGVIIGDVKKNRKEKKNDDFKGGFGWDENAKDYADSAISDILFKKREKKKVGKEKLESIIASYNRSVKKNMSIAQKNFNEMAKLGYKTAADVNSFFTTRNTKIGSVSKKMYEALLKTKVESSGCIRLSDVLANSPLSEYLFIDGFDTKIITNDELWLNLLYYRSVKTRLEGEDKYSIALFESAKISKVTVVSKPLIFNGEDSLKRGYYQDFSSDLAIIGYELLNNDNKNLLLDGKYGSKFEFDYNGNLYKCYGTADSCIIYNSKKIQLNALKEKAENLKIFGSIGDFEFGLKKIDYDADTMRYVDCTVKPESFCPAFFILSEPVIYGFLIKVDIDYNVLFSIMDECLKEKNEVFTTADLFYWDTINQFFDFLFVYILTSPVLSSKEEIKTTLLGYYNIYNTYKKLINLWKQNQLLLQRICYDFYRSFSGKINIDKVKSLEDKITRYLKLRGGLVSDDSYEELLDFFKRCPFCSGMIASQFDEQCFQLPFLIKQAIDDLNNNNSDGLVEEFRNIGYIIYSISFSVEFDTGTCFPFSVSKAAFLGDVSYGINETPIVNNLIRIQNAQSNAQDLNGRVIDLASGVLENMDANKLILITNYLEAKNKDENLKLTNDDILQVAEQAFSSMDKKQSADLAQKVIRARLANRSLENEIYNDIGDFADQPLYDFQTILYNNEANNKIDVINAKKQINNLINKVKTNQDMDEDNFSSVGQVVYLGDDSKIIGDKNKIEQYIRDWEYILKELAKNNVNFNTFKYVADVIRYSGQFPNSTVSDMLSYIEKQTPEAFVANYASKIPTGAVPLIVNDYRMPKLEDTKRINEYVSEDLEPIGIKYTLNYVTERNKNDGDVRLKDYKFKKGKEDTTNYGTKYSKVGSDKKQQTYQKRGYSSAKRRIIY